VDGVHSGEKRAYGNRVDTIQGVDRSASLVFVERYDHGSVGVDAFVDLDNEFARNQRRVAVSKMRVRKLGLVESDDCRRIRPISNVSANREWLGSRYARRFRSTAR